MNKPASAPSLLPLETPTSDGRIFLNVSVWFVDADSISGTVPIKPPLSKRRPASDFPPTLDSTLGPVLTPSN
jgi:hypothetical protein